MLRPKVQELEAERVVRELVRVAVHLQHHKEVQVQLFLDAQRRTPEDHLARVRQEVREMP